MNSEEENVLKLGEGEDSDVAPAAPEEAPPAPPSSEPKKRGRGRPPGSKNSTTSKRSKNAAASMPMPFPPHHLQSLSATVMAMQSQMAGMQHEMEYRLSRIQTLETKCLSMQREIDDMKRRGGWGGGGGGRGAPVVSHPPPGAAMNGSGHAAPHPPPPASASNGGAGSNPTAGARVVHQANRAATGTNMVRAAEADILEAIERRRREGAWPVKYKCADAFGTAPELNRLRLFSSKFVKHELKRYPLPRDGGPCNKGKRCVLCSSTPNGEKKTRDYCGLCEAPLCKKVRPGNDVSCFEAWHSVADLRGERQRRMEASVAEWNKQKQNRRSKGGNDEEDAEEEDDDIRNEEGEDGGNIDGVEESDDEDV